MLRSWLFLALLVVCQTPGFAQRQKSIQPSRWNLFSVEQDIQLGKEAAAEIEKKLHLVDNRELSEYVVRIGRKLAAQPEASQYPYTFKVVSDKTVNAFALPGGPAYVHTGLMLAAANEAQLAGVLAHEIAHVALRHGTAQVSKANALQLLAGLGGMVLGGGSMLGQLAQLGVGLGANSLLLKFSRDAESDADILGARMMAKAGYDPVEMAHFFETLEEQEKRSGRSMPQFLSDHPNPGNRVKAVTAEVRLMPARQYTRGDAAELRRVQAVIKSLPAPPKAAATDFRSLNPESARPNGRFKQYRSRGLSFSYPENWELFQSQQTTNITVASREGIRDTNGNAEIAYGAIVAISPSRTRPDLEADTQRLIDTLIRNNRQMHRSNESQKRISVAGGPALLNILYSQSAYGGQREVDAIVTLEHPQGLLYMALIAPEGEYAQAQPTFDQMIRSLQVSR
jgi:predicted Zn-dependent protease